MPVRSKHILEKTLRLTRIFGNTNRLMLWLPAEKTSPLNSSHLVFTRIMGQHLTNINSSRHVSTNLVPHNGEKIGTVIPARDSISSASGDQSRWVSLLEALIWLSSTESRFNLEIKFLTTPMAFLTKQESHWSTKRLDQTLFTNGTTTQTWPWTRLSLLNNFPWKKTLFQPSVKQCSTLLSLIQLLQKERKEERAVSLELRFLLSDKSYIKNLIFKTKNK